MRTIAIETSSSAGSIAALEHGRLVTELELGQVQRTAQSLSPTFQSILGQAGWKPREVELIAVTHGPGSFTGLRAAVTTSKVFAYVTGAEVVALNTLEVIAAQAIAPARRLWSVMDAQRQQVFAAQFSLGGDSDLRPLLATEIVDNEVWLEGLADGDHVTGLGLTKLLKRLPVGVSVVPEEFWIPRATTLGQLALAKYESGERTDFWQLAPQYFRKSAAEEKFEQGASQ